MSTNKFDPKKLKKLNDPQRLIDIPPEFVQSKLSVEKPKVLVDIGAGTGFFSLAFLNQLTPSTLYACDLSDAMLGWMKENVTKDHPAIIPVKSQENCVPLDDGVADLAFMITLHHELENPSLMLKEAHRILKPGGDIFIVDWKKEEMPQGPPVEIRCLPEEVADQLTAGGFGSIQIFTELPKHFLVVGKKGL